MEIAAIVLSILSLIFVTLMTALFAKRISKVEQETSRALSREAPRHEAVVKAIADLHGGIFQILKEAGLNIPSRNRADINRMAGRYLISNQSIEDLAMDLSVFLPQTISLQVDSLTFGMNTAMEHLNAIVEEWDPDDGQPPADMGLSERLRDYVKYASDIETRLFKLTQCNREFLGIEDGIDKDKLIWWGKRDYFGISEDAQRKHGLLDA